MTDARGNILLANTAAENLFNFKADRAEGKPLIETIINHEVDDLLKKCLSTQQKQTASVDTTSGKFLRVLAVPLKTARISGALILFQDLTELRNLQTMRRMFVGNVSHELRTPLAGIKAVIETLQDGAVNDPQAAMEFLDKAHAETDSMTQMIDELIELSRIETGRTKLELAEMDLNQLAGEVIGRLTVQAERKQITVRTEFAPDLPAVKADRQRMQEVITNILHNAIKFTPSGGRIEIKTQSAENAVTLRVTDTGIGISQDDLPHIFERFFKADKSRTREGSGLGLAIAKHIIQAHGGKIWVESREGQGSTFGFSLPSFKA
jgi:two-component system phosphate regulon sensor histidine kinase PhoR